MNDPICIVEHDDPDVDRIREHVRAKVLRLGLSSNRYSLTCDSKRQWKIGDGESSISFDDIEDAPFIWYRRWKVSPPASAVAAPSELGPDAGAFIERQWETTLATLLQAGYEGNPRKWSRAPHRLDNKIRTNERLDSLGLLPDTRIALTPPKDDAEWVWKPLHTDQSVGEGRAAAIAITSADQNLQQPCPAFYQRQVEYETELRVAYVFGEVAAVSQQPENDNPDLIDKRYVDMVRAPFHSLELTGQAKRVACAINLKVFTADVLVDRSGQFWWIDVNPDGLFCAADSPDGHLLATVSNEFSRRAAVR